MVGLEALISLVLFKKFVKIVDVENGKIRVSTYISFEFSTKAHLDSRQSV